MVTTYPCTSKHMAASPQPRPGLPAAATHDTDADTDADKADRAASPCRPTGAAATDLGLASLGQHAPRLAWASASAPPSTSSPWAHAGLVRFAWAAAAAASDATSAQRACSALSVANLRANTQARPSFYLKKTHTFSHASSPFASARITTLRNQFLG